MAGETLSGAQIRAAIQDNPMTRERDLAHKLGIREAQLIAAQAGHAATRIVAYPDQVVPAAEALGEVMALTRNESCVHEKVGTYANYHSGEHASMVLTHDIDLRIFPAQWVHGFAVEKETEAGLRRSLQIFDAAGDAIHKIHLRDNSDLGAWEKIKTGLALPWQQDTLVVSDRRPVEPAKERPEQRDILIREWERLTDTHQFLRLCSKLKMNRLGAYRVAGAPFARALSASAVDQMLEAVRDSGCEFMFFVGNRGCIQIHNGPIHRLREMGPWQNILDPGFDMHLRRDHIAEVWAVEKPTRRGAALSVEAFDAEGGLIFQAFPVSKEGNDHRPQWKEIVNTLAQLQMEAAQ